MTTRSSVEQFLSQKTLALAGASRGGKKFGNAILKDLTAKGYELSLVHPEAGEIDGLKCYPSVTELPGQVGGLVVAVPADQTEKIVQEAVATGIRNIWMQQGSESSEAIRLCKENGVNEVHGECILMFAQPTGIHRFHRWLWGLFGKLPAEEA
jgi:predicted CoA-binding protein